MAAEKRRDARVDTKQDIWIEGQEIRTVAHAGNMSKRGMLVVAPRDSIQVGSTVAVGFDDPQEGGVTVTMQVVWRNERLGKDHIGLEALDSEGLLAFQRVVARYIDRSLPPPPPPPAPSTPAGDE